MGKELVSIPASKFLAEGV